MVFSIDLDLVLFHNLFTNSVLESLKAMGKVLNAEIAKAVLNHPGGWMRRSEGQDFYADHQNTQFWTVNSSKEQRVEREQKFIKYFLVKRNARAQTYPGGLPGRNWE